MNINFSNFRNGQTGALAAALCAEKNNQIYAEVLSALKSDYLLGNVCLVASFDGPAIRAFKIIVDNREIYELSDSKNLPSWGCCEDTPCEGTQSYCCFLKSVTLLSENSVMDWIVADVAARIAAIMQL